MIVDNKLYNKLRDFGLNSYETKIWTALLSRGISSAGELSDISNVPRSRTYDVLESLEKKGFIMMKVGKPIKYIAISPEEVIERVKKNIESEAKTKVELVEQIKEDMILTELNNLYKTGIDVVDPSELTSSFRNRNSVYSNLNQLIKGSEDSIDIITSTQGLIRKSTIFKKNLEKAASRGVKIRILAPITTEAQKAANVLSNFADVKHLNSIRARFAIVDGKNASFHLLDDEKASPNYDVGIAVNTEFFANSLKQMFENVWNQAK
jgi:sugar-specific transcriptional regulator TrmB